MLKKYLSLLTCIFVIVTAAADDHSILVTPTSTNVYKHRVVIGSGVISSGSMRIFNASAEVAVSQVIQTNAPCDMRDAKGDVNSHVEVLVKLQSTGRQAQSSDFDDYSCYISNYTIDTANVQIFKSGQTNTGYTVFIPFSVYQNQQCGTFYLQGFAATYTVYCVQNN